MEFDFDKQPLIGPQVPRRGNALTRALGQLVLRLFGWRAVGTPPDAPKFIVAAVPHTSNVDGIWFLVAAFALGVDVRFIGKHTLFKGIWGPILRTMGGVSVVRHAAKDVVAQIVDEFENRDGLVLVIAPEGTRNRVERWKTGFHRIALQADVPIALGFVDYRRKRVGFGPHFHPGDLDADLAQMEAFYRDITPRNPEKFHLPD